MSAKTLQFKVTEMSWIFLVVTMFLMHTPGHSLICFSCSSDSREKCEALQTATICKPNELACLTLTYDSYLHNRDIGLATVTVGSVFKKKCVSGNVDCKMYCRYLAGIGKYNCLSKCCDTDFCNLDERLVKVSSSNPHPFSKASKRTTTNCLISISCAIVAIILLS